jgi:hypothetical protein
MAELKTKETDTSVDAYIDAIDNEVRRDDCRALVKLMKQVTKSEPKMWGTSIVGFGKYHYKYASGHEGDSCLTGFASRKKDLTMYITAGFDEHAELLSRLGKFKSGKGCLYVKRLDDIDKSVLKQLLTASVKRMKALYP